MHPQKGSIYTFVTQLVCYSVWINNILKNTSSIQNELELEQR